MKKKKLSLGVSDFKKLITQNLYFVDKSLFIKDVVDGMEILLYPRPRRFGKTLNLSMLRYFYDNSEDNARLFQDLAISQEEDIMEKQGKYPVIFMTFKDVKEESLEISLKKLFSLISWLFNDLRYLMKSDFLDIDQKDYFQKILSKTASYDEYQVSLQKLCQFLYQYHKVNPVVLIDEYDTPIHAGYFHGYYDEIVSFFRGFLSGGLKDNTYLEKGVLTGILRVSKESIFSDLNNITVNSILKEKSADKFGFTETEVEEILSYYDFCVKIDDVKNMYNGYNFSGINIYNPWSILGCINDKRLGYFWVNSSANSLIKTMCQEADETVKQDLKVLIEGGIINKKVKDNIVFPDMKEDKNAIWSFFLMCGYLRYDNYIDDCEIRDTNVELSIPNKEIRTIFVETIEPFWFNKPTKTDDLINLAHLLVEGDIDVFIKEFTEFCMVALSYFDVGGNEPERFYHAFVLGMLTCLKDRYLIRSNREAGHGRYDIMITPKFGIRNSEFGIPNSELRTPNSRGVIFEFKTIDENERDIFALMSKKDPFELAFDTARSQLAERQYDVEMRAEGVEEIVTLIAVFKGKEVRVIKN